jgi:hypothetical protein
MQSNHEFTAWVKRDGFPKLILLGLSEPPTFIGLNGCNTQISCEYVMNATGMFRRNSSDAFYGVMMNFASSDNTAGAVTFGDVFNYGDEFFEWEFGIPVWCVSSFAEFSPTGQAFEESRLALTVVFAEFNVANVGFGVIFTIGEGAG